MKKVCVITGGGSGMGLAAAKFMPKDRIIIIAGRTEKKLIKAAEELEELGYTVKYKTCDTSLRESVKELAEFAAKAGKVQTVINSAGLSPAMSDPETIVRVNALGTVYVNKEFSAVMEKGGVTLLIDAMSYQYLVGAKIDFKEGLSGEQFVIDNPNAVTTCGCGSSFSV